MYGSGVGGACCPLRYSGHAPMPFFPLLLFPSLVVILGPTMNSSTWKTCGAPLLHRAFWPALMMFIATSSGGERALRVRQTINGPSICA